MTEKQIKNEYESIIKSVNYNASRVLKATEEEQEFWETRHRILQSKLVGFETALKCCGYRVERYHEGYGRYAQITGYSIAKKGEGMELTRIEEKTV